MTSLSIALLGPPEVRRGAEIVEIPIRKSLALLAYLAVTGRPQPREALAALLWPEADHQRARGALRYALAELRRALGDWLVADRQSVGLDWSREILVDVAAFRRGAGARDLAGLREAAELWRGDFLSGFSLEDSPAFDDWQLFEAEGLRQELARCLEALVAGLIGAGQPREAIGPARRWVSLDAWHEPAHCALMEALARSGQRQAALRQYDACARTLEEGLGLRPSEETERLRQRLLADPPPARTGEPASLADAAPPAHNLPPQQTAFVGRDAELAQLAAYLADPQRRLITLAGPGG
ncbi:MAG TPA: BTAD domain-containing putative transcriptional regulator, partial [Herpetosiphonaceae bacterium]